MLIQNERPASGERHVKIADIQEANPDCQIKDRQANLVALAEFDIVPGQLLWVRSWSKYNLNFIYFLNI